MILQELSPVITAATSLNPFFHSLPDRPDTAIALIPAPSPSAQEVFSQTQPLYRRNRINVLCRSNKAETAELLAEQVYQYAQGIVNQQEGGTWYLALNPVGEPFNVGRDKDNRLIVSLSLEAWKESSSI